VATLNNVASVVAAEVGAAGEETEKSHELMVLWACVNRGVASSSS
jgi:hypothetical protein